MYDSLTFYVDRGVSINCVSHAIGQKCEVTEMNMSYKILYLKACNIRPMYSVYGVYITWVYNMGSCVHYNYKL